MIEVTVPFFDAHSDTVLPVLAGELDFVSGRGKAHIDLPRLAAAGVGLQVFAVFTSRRHHPGRDLRAYADQAIATIRGWAEEAQGGFKLALAAEDLEAACAGAAVYGLIGLEGADCLGEQADALDHFVEAGVRLVIPAWDDNAFSGTVFGDGGPLTAEGERLIELCQARGVMVDVSHLSDLAFWRICEITRKPFVASHSNCRALCPSMRNLTDEMIRALAERGGVMGMNLSADFLDPEYMAAGEALGLSTPTALRDAPEAERLRLQEVIHSQLAAVPLPQPAWMARHLLHAIQVGGEECVGLGGDLDGIEFMPRGMRGVESYPWMAEMLVEAGLTPRQVDKISWQNMARVFGEVLPQRN